MMEPGDARRSHRSLRGGRQFSHPNESPILHPFAITEADKHDLVKIQHTLTDTNLVHEPRWSNPWPPSNGSNLSGA
jgi:hypothetical protein